MASITPEQNQPDTDKILSGLRLTSLATTDQPDGQLLPVARYIQTSAGLYLPEDYQEQLLISASPEIGYLYPSIDDVAAHTLGVLQVLRSEESLRELGWVGNLLKFLQGDRLYRFVASALNKGYIQRLTPDGYIITPSSESVAVTDAEWVDEVNDAARLESFSHEQIVGMIISVFPRATRVEVTRIP